MTRVFRGRRARTGAPTPIDPDWVLPFQPENDQRRWTTIGNVASPYAAIVDPRGLVTPSIDGWSLDWWIGADDRWYVPSREAPSRLRQGLLGASPVVETAMRIPSGEAIHRAYSIVGGPNADDDLVIVEIENRSRVPFALALAIRPYNPEGLAPIERIDMHDDTTVTVDGRVALLLPKPPARVAASTFDEGDSALVVMDGRAVTTDQFPTRLRDDAGMAQAAFVFPLPHTASLRVALPMVASKRAVAYPSAIPSPAQVASGWAAQSKAGFRLELPDARLQEAVDASRRFLLVLHDGADITAGPRSGHTFDFRDAATMLAALDRHGFHPQAAEVLRSYPERQRADGSFIAPRSDVDANGCALWSLAEHWRLTHDREFLDAVRGSVAVGAHRIDRAGRRTRHNAERPDLWTLAGLRGAADLLAAAGEIDGARRVRDAADALGGHDGAARHPLDDEGDELARLQALLDAASPTWTWPETIHPQLPGGCAGEGHDGRAAARFLSLVRNLLVREVDGEASALVLCSMIPDEWWGRGIEVHDAPTHFGRMSYAVRWHGERPALLWDLERFDGVDAVRVTVPGLDPAWSSAEPRGEALLAPMTTREAAG